MSVVGIIANPSAGKDIRRLVAQGRVVSNQEKSNSLRRVFAGLKSMDVERVLVMRDMAGLARQAMSDWEDKMSSNYIDLEPTGSQNDSVAAARMMQDLDVKCIITLGGDGTNRMVAKGCGQVPIAPISTGTNNVFPKEIEGTLAGIAAGAVASGKAKIAHACKRSKMIEVLVNNEKRDIALVDAAIARQSMVGARAVWNTSSLHSVFLTRAHAATIGISSIGARLKQVEIDDPHGLYIKFAEPNSTNFTKTFKAPIAPGIVHKIQVANWAILQQDETYQIGLQRGTIALDGEREIELLPTLNAEVRLNVEGPWVVDFDKTLEIAAAS